jgi:large subunit ribosomal protein L9
MKVILKEYVYMHGVAGDVVDVADGFARNYLIPQGKAVKATPEAIERSESLLAEATIRREELNEQLVALANKVNGTELIFGRRAERNNKLYGSVTTMDIADAILEATGVDINRRRISERPLREIGEFEVPIRMGQDLAPVVKVIIVREEDMEDFLKARERGEAALEAGDEADAGETATEMSVAEGTAQEVVEPEASAEAVEAEIDVEVAVEEE